MKEGDQERPVIVRVDNRFVHGKGDETCITAEDEVVEVRRFETTPAIVRRGYGLTLNQGNYESARIDVSVEVPCYLTDIAKADKWAAEFCEQRVRKEVASARAKKKETAPI
jgi:hypothetical protein